MDNLKLELCHSGSKMAEKISLDIVEIRNIGDDIKIKAIPR